MCAVVGVLHGAPTVRHSIGRQCVKFGQAQLQGMKAEHVGDQCIHFRRFPRLKVTSGGRVPKIWHPYNLFTHENSIETAAYPCVF